MMLLNLLDVGGGIKIWFPLNQEIHSGWTGISFVVKLEEKTFQFFSFKPMGKIASIK